MSLLMQQEILKTLLGIQKMSLQQALTRMDSMNESEKLGYLKEAIRQAIITNNAIQDQLGE